MDEWLAALEIAAPIAALRDSIWAYPLINAGHILGVSLIVGAILPLDLRVLGVWPRTPLAAIWPILTRTAAAGIIVAIICGALLFATDAREYIATGMFQLKLLFIVIGISNAFLLRLGSLAGIGSTHGFPPHISIRLKIAAIVSLLCWLSALTLGRLVGYL